MTAARDPQRGQVSDVDQIDADVSYGASRGSSAHHRTRFTSALSAGHAQWGEGSEELHSPPRSHWPIPLALHPLEAPAERPGSRGAAVRRLVVVPSLWAPFHHRPAVAALAAFAEATQPDAIVFMNAPATCPRRRPARRSGTSLRHSAPPTEDPSRHTT
jgi:hypothetical protein